MKKLLVLSLVSLVLTACGTVGGAVEGAGQDLQQAGKWVRNVGK
jgi:predicted small secreted protein